jgi:hypothetical protein
MHERAQGPGVMGVGSEPGPHDSSSPPLPKIKTSTVVIWSGHIGSREDHALLLGKDLGKDLVNQGTLG